ncbi:Zn-ribbon domain-containing OB-fold protein [Actinomadura sp. 9N407]|uniref:Zn-ribbon domain-containing OB-fold protein n=1 Tax=Actinomadura sp. 9N407 TaxID=3375154 RepID=UPI003798584B
MDASTNTSTDAKTGASSDASTDAGTDAHLEIGILRRDGRTDPFFDGTAADRLVIRRCEPCGRWYAPDQSSCPECGEEDLDWVPAEGTATLVTWTVTRSRTGKAPAYLALVELAEGPWLHARLDGVAPEALREGLPLRATFVHPAEGESYMLFKSHMPSKS